MSYDLDGIMVLFSGKYRPEWENPCGGDDVDGVMEKVSTKYRPKLSFGICEDKTGIMVESSSKYFPRITLDSEYQCCIGDDCGCWDDGATPMVVKATVSGVLLCDGTEEDPNGEYTLTQYSEDWPCLYYGTKDGSDHFTIQWRASGLYEGTLFSSLYIWSTDLWYFGRTLPGGGCDITYNNAYKSDYCGRELAGGYGDTTRRIVAAYDGEAEITWG